MTKTSRTPTLPSVDRGQRSQVIPLLPRLVERTPSSDNGLLQGAAPAAAPAEEGCGQPLPRLLSATEVAALFNCSERTIRNWVRHGYLRPVRVGRSLFFVEADIRELIAGRLCRDILTRAQGRPGTGTTPRTNPSQPHSKPLR